MQRSVTNRRRNELREAFTLFDKDGDGTIDSNELKTVMKTAGLHPTDRDIERSFYIQFRLNFWALRYFIFLWFFMGRILLVISNFIKIKSSTHRLIRVCDADRSGVIEFNEFILMMHENDKISEEDVRSGFRIFDKDGDGNITPSELK